MKGRNEMTTEEEKGEELKAIQPVDSNPTTVGASKTFEELSEEYDDWDENIHTYASDRVGHRIRTNSAGAEQISRSLNGDTNPSIFTPRQKRKVRSQSFSERSLRKHSLHGTAKEHAMLSKQNSMGSESNTITSNPSTSASKHDPEFYKAVNEYYNRLANGFHNEKNYDSLFGTPDYIVKGTTLAANNNNKASSNSDPHLTTRQFNRSIYWLVHNRRKYGFRHLCMLILVLVYTLLGAAMFFTIEAKHEHHTVAERKAALDKSLFIIARQLMSLQNGTDIFANMSSAEEFVKSTYISLLKDESLYEGSTYWKASDTDNFKWTYASAFFFSMNLYTTTGYGSIAAESILGRICVMWYSMLTIPITLVVIRDLGQATLVCLTKVYAHILVKVRRTMGYLEPHEDSMISLPIKFCLMLLAGYLLFTAAFIYLFDDWMGYIPHSGLSFFTSLYFSYISISTIGLGDIMPNNATFHPIISILFFFGMPVMKVVNRATYICIENGVFGAFTLLENSIDRMTSKIKPREEPQPSRRPSRKISRCSYCSHINDGEEEDKATELLNGLTIRSLAAFARTNADVYGGGFGRVNLRKGDLVQSKTSVGQNPDPSP
uniref:Ion channel n=1 Tax=Haemonchus contortus TaxID=6289 RepID=A0A7I4YPK2_HAECO